MFLSKLVLNLRDRQARRDLAAPYEMHRTLLAAAFTRRRSRPRSAVPRRYRSRTGAARRPGPIRPPARVGSAGRTRIALLAGPGRVQAVSTVLRPGQRLRFRLRANPTKQVAPSKTERLAGAREATATEKRPRLALLREDEQIAWLLRKGENGGFRIPGEWVDAGTRDGRAVQAAQLPRRCHSRRLGPLRQGRPCRAAVSSPSASRACWR